MSFKPFVPKVSVPELTTPRLRLRGHSAHDFAAIHAMWCESSVNQFLGKQGATESQTWMRLLTYVGHWAVLGFGYWLVEERDTGEFVGEVGFADFHRDVTPSLRVYRKLVGSFHPTSKASGTRPRR